LSDGIPSPSPDFPQQIKNVTGNANVKIQNKNLAWNGWAQDFVNRVNNRNNASIIIEDNRNCLFYKNSIGGTMVFNQDWKENTQYTFSFYIKTNYSPNLMIEYTDGTTTQINRSLITINSWSKIEVTSNANKTVKYLRGINEGGNDYIDLDTFMVLEGAYTAETIPSYVPHQEQNYPFTFSEGQRAMQGTTLEDDGIHNARARVDLSTLTWAQYATNKYQSSSLSNVIKKPLSPSIKANIFAEKYIVVPQSASFTNGVIGIGTNGAILCMDETGTPSGILEYELSEEAQKTEIIPYNETQQAQYNDIKNARSYDDITYISSESDELGFNMNVVAVADANKVIDNQNNEIDTIKSRLDLLEG